jgi:hypothetical protein
MVKGDAGSAGDDQVPKHSFGQVDRSGGASQGRRDDEPERVEHTG